MYRPPWDEWSGSNSSVNVVLTLSLCRESGCTGSPLLSVQDTASMTSSARPSTTVTEQIRV